MTKTGNTFRAFQNRNYRLYFTGQGLSQVGTWMQRTGVSWVVYTMTHSALMLGLTIFASQFPSFLLSLFGGIVADRYDRYKVLLITQTASMVQAVLLAILVLTNHYTVSEILTLSVILGMINAFDLPARQPLVHELVNNKEDLPNALALNSTMVNLAVIIGPVLSGLVLEKFGAGICFLLNAISFLAVLISLLLMKLPKHVPSIVKNKIASELSEGFRYLKNTPAISIVLLLLTTLSLFILPYNTLLPVFAKVIFKGDARTFGYITSFIGLGAIGSSLVLASLKKGTDLKVIALINIVLLGIGLIFFSHISYFPLALLFAVLTGFGTMSQTTICITIIQVHSDAAMRGRMMSYVAMAYFGMLPLGSLLIGAISQRIGAPDAMFCQGILAIIVAIVFSNFLKGDKMDKKDIEQLEEAEILAAEKI
jgi:MFS family permease